MPSARLDGRRCLPASPTRPTRSQPDCATRSPPRSTGSRPTGRGPARGVIHADLFPDNVFFIGDKLSGLIDFYFACNDCLRYDIAICLNAWCFEDDYSFNVTKAQALLHGYSEVRPLTEAECAALPMLARGAALRFLLTRCL